MDHRIVSFIVFSALAASIAWAQQRGYVLKRGDGELLMGGEAIIKVSPATGSQSGEVFWQTMASGGTTGIHIHHEADEFFYVVTGEGSALIGDQETPIAAGDVVFVPKGEQHRLRHAGAEGSLEVVFFVDRPGLANEFREGHTRFEALGRWLTLEELNEISERHGTTYLTTE